MRFMTVDIIWHGVRNIATDNSAKSICVSGPKNFLGGQVHFSFLINTGRYAMRCCLVSRNLCLSGPPHNRLILNIINNIIKCLKK